MHIIFYEKRPILQQLTFPFNVAKKLGNGGTAFPTFLPNFSTGAAVIEK